MTRRFTLVLLGLLLLAAPAPSFWGAFFAGIGKAVGKAIGFPQGSINAAGMMPVTVKAAKPVIDAAQERLAELQGISSAVSDTLDHYAGAAGTLRELGSLERFRSPATQWIRSEAADRYGTSGDWIRALNGDSAATGAVDAYAAAAAPVPDWSAALPTLPGEWQAGVRHEHATLELSDAASVRLMTVLGELRRHAPGRVAADVELERAALDPSAGSQAVPALLGKVAVGQIRQIRGTEQTNQLLDALLEAELAGLKRERDRLARSMEAAAEYSSMAAALPAPQWRMP